MKIVLALIGKDEKENVVRLLESVKDGIEGVAYVDTGSTDGTEQAVIDFCSVNNLRCITEKFAWEDNFSKARNVSFELAREDLEYDWLMWLDCDDVFGDIIGLRYALEQVRDDVDCILLPYFYAWDDKGNPSTTLERERLFRFSANPRWESRRIHECVDISKYNVQSLNYPVHHRRSVEDIAKDGERNVRLLKLEYETNRDPRTLFYLARETFHSGNGDKALELFQLRIDNKKDPGSYDERFASYMYMAEIWIAKKDFRMAFKTLAKAVNLHDDVPDTYFLLGVAYEGLNKPKAAIHAYESAIRSDCQYRGVSRGIKGVSTIGGYPKLYNDIYRGVNALNTKYQLGVYIPRSYIEPLKKLEFLYYKLEMYEEAYRVVEQIKEYYGEGYIDHDYDHLRDLLKLRISDNVTKQTMDNGGLKLNLGSGSQQIPGFVGLDKYDERAEIRSTLPELKLPPRSCSKITAFHFFEHLDNLEWEEMKYEISRVMKAGGILEVTVPNFEICSKALLNNYELWFDGQPTILDLSVVTYFDWYMKTVFGRQVTDDKIDPGQFHKRCFLRKHLVKELEAVGFSIIKQELYDDNDTPSIRIIAVKKQIVFFPELQEGLENPTSRLRHALVYGRIKSIHGNNILIKCSKGKLQQEIKEVFPDMIVLAHYGAEANQIIETWKGKITFVYDYNEDIGGMTSCYDTIRRCDLVVCCSTELAKTIERDIGGIKTIVVPDMYEDNETNEIVKKIKVGEL